MLSSVTAGQIKTWRLSPSYEGALTLTATGKFTTFWKAKTATVQTLAVPKRKRSAWTLTGTIHELTSTRVILTNVQKVE